MWFLRQLSRLCSWIYRQPLRTQILLGVAYVTAPCWLGCAGLFVNALYVRWFVFTAEDRAFFRNESERYPEGVPSVARRLKAEMEAIPDPETATQLHSDWAAVRFKNGEWVFGHGINSHGFRVGRGTLVLKDSRGRIRIFFGHVCGPNAGIDQNLSRNYDTLDSFYKSYTVFEFGMVREWVSDQ